MIIPKRLKRPKMGVREPSKLRSPSHLKWVRGHSCCVSTGACDANIEAHHVRETVDGNGGGIGLKPDDSSAVPLCAFHHQNVHMVGIKTFQALHKIDLTRIAETLWQRSPHRPREAA